MVVPRFGVFALEITATIQKTFRCCLMTIFSPLIISSGVAVDPAQSWSGKIGQATPDN